MPDLSDIVLFVAAETGISADRLNPTADIFGPSGISGDDCDELLVAFSAKYSVDMSGYLWYFHHAEEASLNLGGLLFRPPNARVAHIPVTIRLLLEAVVSKRWPITYPPHRIPKRRYDMWVNVAVLGAVAIVVVVALV